MRIELTHNKSEVVTVEEKQIYAFGIIDHGDYELKGNVSIRTEELTEDQQAICAAFIDIMKTKIMAAESSGGGGDGTGGS